MKSKVTFENRLFNVKNRQHFMEEVAQIFSPYGQVKGSKLLVEKNAQKSEGSCFVEMETPQQAMAAHSALDVLLMGSRHLFFSVNLSEDFIE